MSQGPPVPAPFVASGVVDSSVPGILHAGTPVYITPTGTLKPANAGADSTAVVVGLLRKPAVKNEVASYRSAGPLNLQVGQWDAVLPAESAGLVPGDAYYVNDAGGQISNIAPSGSGNLSTQVGIALSMTLLLVGIVGPAGTTLSP